MNLKKLSLYVFVVILFIAAIFGAAYSWFTWQSSPSTVSGEIECFDVEYTPGANISGLLLPSNGYNEPEAKSTTIKMKLKSECSIEGTATIQLISTPGICSNALYTSSYTCENEGETWIGTDDIMFDGALKFAVYKGSTQINSGTIVQDMQNSYIHILATDIPISSVQASYIIYIYLDKASVTNDYLSSKYDGIIKVISIQTAF